MADQSTEATAQASTGAAEQPTSPASGAQASSLPDYVTALQSQVSELQGVVKGLQKGTDKRFGQMDTNIKRILELKDQGLNETQIQRELWIDSQMTPQQQNAPVQQPVGNVQTNQGIDVEPIITSLQFQPNDPALAALKIKYAGDPQGMVKAAADLRFSQLSTPNPSTGTGLPISGGQAQVDGLNAQQVEQLSMKLNRLYDNYSANEQQIKSIERQLDEYWAKQK